MQQALAMFRTPRFLRLLYAWYLRHIRGDEVYAGLVEGWYEKTVPEYLALVAQREAYRARVDREAAAIILQDELDARAAVPCAEPEPNRRSESNA